MVSRHELGTLFKKFIRDKFSRPLAHAGMYSIRVTSGTSSEPLVALLPFSRLIPSACFRGRMLLCAGSMSHRFTIVSTIYQQKKDTPVRVFTVGRNELREGSNLGRCLKEFLPEHIVGVPSLALHVGALLDKETTNAVTSSVFLGEAISSSTLSTLNERFPKMKTRSIYISMELGIYSTAPCGYLAQGQYHVAEHVRMRISSPDPKKEGEILISTEIEPGVRVVDYCSGDIGRLSSYACPCGASDMLEVLGRKNGDYVKVVGALLLSAELERVAAMVPYITDFRVRVSERLHEGVPRGNIELIVYSSRGVGTDALKGEVSEIFARNLFLTPTRTLSQLIQESVFDPLVVTWVERPFPQEYKQVRIQTTT